MVEEIGASQPPYISMPSAMPAGSVSPTESKAETNTIRSPESKAHSLLRLPPELALYVSRTDVTLLRLNKLLTTTAGLECLLSTLNYTCYLLTFLYARSPSRAKLIQLLLSGFLLRPPPTSKPRSPNPPPPTSKLAHLTNLLTNTRTTLRLTALLPLYAWLRNLLSSARQPSASPPDPYLHAVALTQCISYILYQALENIAHLIDLHILPASLTTSRYNPCRTSSPGTSKLWLISSRFWLVGVSCDILRLLREAYVEAQRRRRHTTFTEAELKEKVPTAAEAKATDRRLWSELFVAGCWLPMCAHYSVKGGLFRPNVENGVVGALGLVASWEGWRVAWAETTT